MKQQNAQLVVEALFLAMELNAKLKEAYDRGELHKGHKLLRITGKAWARYHRRRAAVGT